MANYTGGLPKPKGLQPERLLAIEKGLHPQLGLIRLPSLHEKSDSRADRFAERQMLPFADQLLLKPDGSRPVLENRSQASFDGSVQVVSLHHGFHQAPLFGSVG